MFILKKNKKLLIAFLILLFFSLNLDSVHAAMSGSGNEKNETSLYESGKKLVIRAKKLEKKSALRTARTNKIFFIYCLLLISELHIINQTEEKIL